MKLHSTLVDRLLKLMEINSGWKEEWKLKAALNNLDISVYTTEKGEKILVPTEEYQKYLNTANNAEKQLQNQRMEKLIAEAKRVNGGT